MRVNFENAKRLYQTKLLPMLEQQHEIDLEVDREKARTNKDVADKLQRFENDDRLVKSLLLSALVHGVDTLKNMTCTRLAALNHGTIRSRIPGREHQVVAQKLRTWVDLSGGVIHLSDDPINPTVAIQLSGVETESIIEAARVYDNPGNRQFKIRGMLFKSLDIPEQDELFITHTFWWRGSKRSCDVLFSNVHALRDDALRSSEDWKVIIDFPFDSEGHSPTEDLDRLTRFRDKNERQRTLVWLRRSSRPARRPSWASWSSSTGCCWVTTSTSTPSTCRFRTGRRHGSCSRTSKAPSPPGCFRSWKPPMPSAPNRPPARWTPPTICRSRISSRSTPRWCCNARWGPPWGKR
jgi:hypothetical protein